jgi:hypothetical protein
MTKKTESLLVDKIQKEVRARCPRCLVYKLADAYSRARTDLLIVALSRSGRTWVLFAEVKTDKGKVEPLQQHEIDKIRALHADGDGRVDAIVARSVRDVLYWLQLRGCLDKMPNPETRNGDGPEQEEASHAESQ